MFKRMSISNKIAVYFILIVGLSIGAIVLFINTYIYTNFQNVIKINTRDKGFENSKILNNLIDRSKQFVSQVNNFPLIGESIFDGKNPANRNESLDTYNYLSYLIERMVVDDDYKLNAGFRFFRPDGTIIGKIGTFHPGDLRDVEEGIFTLTKQTQKLQSELTIDRDKGYVVSWSADVITHKSKMIAIVLGGFVIVPSSLQRFYPETSEVTIATRDFIYDTTFRDLVYERAYYKENYMNQDIIDLAFDYIGDGKIGNGLKLTEKQEIRQNSDLTYFNEVKKDLLKLLDNGVNINFEEDKSQDNNKPQVSKIIEDGKFMSMYIPYFSIDGNTKLVLISHNRIDNLEGIISQIILFSIIATVIAIVISIILIRFIAHSIGRKVAYISDILLTASKGDLSIRVDKFKTEDELSVLNTSLNELLMNNSKLISYVKLYNKRFYKANKQLNLHLKDIEVSIEQLKEKIMITLDYNTEEEEFLNKFMETVEETIAGFNRIYSVLRVQQSFADTMKGTMNNITDSIKTINIVTNESKEVTEELKQSATVISNSTKELLESISGIEEGSKEIQDIVSLISNIAEQTNMLAMNASIEAAHAGSSGKGFGVVADEIRTLAENSTSQAKEIKKVLKDIIKRISDAVEISKRNESNTVKITQTVDKVYNTNIDVSKIIDQQIESMKSIEKEISASLEVTNEVSDYSKEQNKKINQFKEEINVLIDKMKNVKMAMDKEVKESENTIKIIISMKEVRKENMVIRTKLEDSINKFKVAEDGFDKEQTNDNEIDMESKLITEKEPKN